MTTSRGNDLTAMTPPPGFATTREALRALACYVIAPARKARTGRIGLRPTAGGFGTPPFDDGTRIVVHGDQLIVEPDREAPITTLHAAAELVQIALSPDPGVGDDLPAFTPDVSLAVDATASRWLGAWYAFGARHLDWLADRSVDGTVSEAQLWPEHFDLAAIVDLNGEPVNVGFSPGDAAISEPYVYVGPHDTTGLDGDYWNASFGAVLGHDEVRAATDPDGVTNTFIDTGLRLLEARRTHALHTSSELGQLSRQRR
jgi:hypothetical protein